MYNLAKKLLYLSIFFIPLEYLYEYLTGSLTIWKIYRVLILATNFLVLFNKKRPFSCSYKVFQNIPGISYITYLILPLIISSIMQIGGNVYFTESFNFFLLLLFPIILSLNLIYFSITSNFGEILVNSYYSLSCGLLTSSFLGFALQTNKTFDGIAFRSTGMMNNPNHFAFIGAIVFISTFLLPLRNSKNRLKNLLIFGIPSLLTILGSGSRSALIASIFSITFCILIKFLKNKKLSIINLLLIILGISLFALLFENIIPLIINTKVANRYSAERIFNFQESGRTSLFLLALNVFRSSPLFGVGFGNFLPKSSNFYNSDIISGLSDNLRKVSLGTHNEYLRTLAESGLLGFTGLIIFVIFSFYYLLKNSFSQKNNISQYSLFILSLVIFNCTYSFTQDQISFIPYFLINSYFIVFYHLSKNLI